MTALNEIAAKFPYCVRCECKATSRKTRHPLKPWRTIEVCCWCDEPIRRVKR